jgi:cobyrinic acid a,c-diamide synthase
MAHLLLSAAHKSSGKTTISLGLCAALHARGLRVQPFKKGPDYIDPMWLALASGQSCYNLDFNTARTECIQGLFALKASQADISLIEGNKGLHDGLARDGSNSNAALAKLLGAPVVLVLDTRGITRGIAPLILGYQAFDRDVNIAGIILNQVGGPRHEAKLRDAVEYHTGLPILGAVHKDPSLHISERHLGLVPSNEAGEALQTIKRIGDSIASQVDLDALLEVAAQAEPLPETRIDEIKTETTPVVRIGIARDPAFGFYYADDLEAMEAAGAELVPINTLTDQQLPDLDGLFIGGGFPEAHLKALEGNSLLRKAIRNAIEDGLPAYAECGGLMYLTRSIHWKGQTGEMVGILPADSVMHERPQGRGYVRVEDIGQAPWSIAHGSTAGSSFSAHEFHYSRLENLPAGLEFAFRIKRGVGIDGHCDGIIYKNLLANYVHLRNGKEYRWTDRFISFVRQHKAKS